MSRSAPFYFFFQKFSHASASRFSTLAPDGGAISQSCSAASAFFGTILVFSTLYTSYSNHSQLLASGGCKIAEGEVVNFVPMPVTGHADESFSVAGVDFHYSDYGVTDAFNNTRSHGGPITAGEYVRICYDPSDFAILQLDIADFKGPIPHYSNVATFPDEPVSKDDGKQAPDMPWDAQLFVWLYFLNFVATVALFVPYLKTFFVLARKQNIDAPINRLLESGGTTKLSNTVLRRDESDQTIWLRARGLNMVQMPVTVVKLSLDSNGRRVTAYETRFSSAVPFIFVAFTWAVYRMIYTTMPSKDSPPVFILVVFIIFAVISIFRVVSRSKTRTQAFVDDALRDLADPNAR